MKIVRLYTGTDGESHFEDIEVELKSIRHMMASELVPAHGIIFRTAPADHYSPYHPAPKRQYVITLCGQVEIETGDGTIRRFGPGDVMLAQKIALETDEMAALEVANRFPPRPQRPI